MRCIHCGKPITESSPECLNCGNRLNELSCMNQERGSVPHHEEKTVQQITRKSVYPGYLQVGQVLRQRYKLTDVVGFGPVGVVYQAFDQEKKIEVAVKLISAEFFPKEENRRQFFHQLRHVHDLNHENVVEYLDLDWEGKQGFYVTELLPGLSLRKIINSRRDKQRTFSLEEVEPIVSQLGQALSDTQQIMAHGGIKPENIFILPDLLKITDFGLAQALPPTAYITAHQEFGTSSYYFSPEVRDSDRFDARADVFSLGVILGELLSGKTFRGNVKDILRALPREVPENIHKILRQSLAPNPQERFESAGQFLLAFNAIIAIKGLRSLTNLKDVKKPESSPVSHDQNRMSDFSNHQEHSDSATISEDRRATKVIDQAVSSDLLADKFTSNTKSDKNNWLEDSSIVATQRHLPSANPPGLKPKNGREFDKKENYAEDLPSDSTTHRFENAGQPHTVNASELITKVAESTQQVDFDMIVQEGNEHELDEQWADLIFPLSRPAPRSKKQVERGNLNHPLSAAAGSIDVVAPQQSGPEVKRRNEEAGYIREQKRSHQHQPKAKEGIERHTLELEPRPKELVPDKRAKDLGPSQHLSELQSNNRSRKSREHSLPLAVDLPSEKHHHLSDKVAHAALDNSSKPLNASFPEITLSVVRPIPSAKKSHSFPFVVFGFILGLTIITIVIILYITKTRSDAARMELARKEARAISLMEKPPKASSSGRSVTTLQIVKNGLPVPVRSAESEETLTLKPMQNKIDAVPSFKIEVSHRKPRKKTNPHPHPASTRVAAPVDETRAKARQVIEKTDARIKYDLSEKGGLSIPTSSNYEDSGTKKEPSLLPPEIPVPGSQPSSSITSNPHVEEL